MNEHDSAETYHSCTSRSQLPVKAVDCELSITVHSVSNSLMKSYSHSPFAKPATHVQRYVLIETLSVVDSLHVAPF